MHKHLKAAYNSIHKIEERRSHHSAIRTKLFVQMKIIEKPYSPITHVSKLHPFAIRTHKSKQLYKPSIEIQMVQSEPSYSGIIAFSSRETAISPIKQALEKQKSQRKRCTSAFSRTQILKRNISEKKPDKLFSSVSLYLNPQTHRNSRSGFQSVLKMGTLKVQGIKGGMFIK